MTNSIFGNRRAASIVLVVGIVIGVLGLTNKGPFIKGAKGYSQEIARSSATAYLSLRLINAAISFAEEVEVGGSVIAVNGSAHPFKVLEPIDDAVERLSAAIFLVGAVSGVLAVVLPVLGGVALVLIGASLAFLAGLDLSNLRFPGRNLLSDLFRGTARLGGLGFLIVIAFSISSWFADGVSKRAWGEYQLTLTNIADQMPKLSSEAGSMLDAEQSNELEDHAELVKPTEMGLEEETGFFRRIGNGLKATGEGAVNIANSAASGVNDLATSAVDGVTGAASSVTASYEKAKNILTVLTAQSDDLVLALMGIFAAFLFKTVVCPMLILIGLWKLAGSLEFMRRDEQIPASERVSDLLCMSNLAHASKMKEHDNNDDFQRITGRAA